MPDHYYTSEPASGHRPAECQTRIFGRTFEFTTDAGVFSRGELDPGSRLLIESAGPLNGRALDLGCGWGAVGIILAYANPGARLLLTDVNRRALSLARGNIARNAIKNADVLESDGFLSVEGVFDAIITNPPIRAGKAVIYGWFQTAHERLVPGGTLTVVIRKQQGAPSAQRHIAEIFGNAEIAARDGGYWIIRSVKEDGYE